MSNKSTLKKLESSQIKIEEKRRLLSKNIKELRGIAYPDGSGSDIELFIATLAEKKKLDYERCSNMQNIVKIKEKIENRFKISMQTYDILKIVVPFIILSIIGNFIIFRDYCKCFNDYWCVSIINKRKPSNCTNRSRNFCNFFNFNAGWSKIGKRLCRCHDLGRLFYHHYFWIDVATISKVCFSFYLFF